MLKKEKYQVSLSDEKSMPADQAKHHTQPPINVVFTSQETPLILFQKLLKGKMSSWVSIAALLIEVELTLNTKTVDLH